MRMASRRGKAGIIGIIMLLMLGAAGGAAWLFGPYYLDYMNMQEVAASASLSWYANDSKAAAVAKLGEELRVKDIEYIVEDDCTIDEVGKLYIVSCYWEVDVYYPYTKYYKTLVFETTAECDKRGVVEVY